MKLKSRKALTKALWITGAVMVALCVAGLFIFPDFAAQGRWAGWMGHGALAAREGAQAAAGPWMHGPGMRGGIAGALFLVIAVGGIIALAGRRRRVHGDPAEGEGRYRAESPIDIVKGLYAEGKIDLAEFKARAAALKE
jgi:hypothetical protein